MGRAWHPDVAARVWYLAGPVAGYGTERRATARRHVLARAGHTGMVLDPEVLWSDTRAWVTHWPALLDLITDLVVITAADGTVGRGVVVEVVDARRRRVRVWRLNASGRFSDATGWSLRRLGRPTLWRYARWTRNPERTMSRRDTGSSRVASPAAASSGRDVPSARTAPGSTRSPPPCVASSGVAPPCRWIRLTASGQ